MVVGCGASGRSAQAPLCLPCRSGVANASIGRRVRIQYAHDSACVRGRGKCIIGHRVVFNRHNACSRHARAHQCRSKRADTVSPVTSASSARSGSHSGAMASCCCYWQCVLRPLLLRRLGAELRSGDRTWTLVIFTRFLECSLFRPLNGTSEDFPTTKEEREAERGILLFMTFCCQSRTAREALLSWKWIYSR